MKNQILIVSLILTISLLGDATLYLALPLYFEAFEVTLFAVAVLLSVNRFSRLFFNQIAMNLISRFGIKQMLLIACFLSALTTFSYGIGLDFYFLIFSRILWGFAYSILRLSVLTVIKNEPSSKIGKKLGTYFSIQEICPIIILLLLGFYIDVVNFKILYSILSAITLFTIFLIPLLKDIKEKRIYNTTFFPELNKNYLFIFSNSFFTEGIFLSSIGLLFHSFNYSLAESAYFASIVLAGKRFNQFLLSYSNGVLIDRFNLKHLMSIGLLFLLFGIILIYLGHIFVASILIITSNNHLNIVISKLVLTSSNEFKQLADMSTWRDLAAATGAFIGLSLFEVLDYRFIYLIFILIFTYYLFYYKNLKLRLSL